MRPARQCFDTDDLAGTDCNLRLEPRLELVGSESAAQRARADLDVRFDDRIFLADGALLASASSGSSELSREAYVALADAHPTDDISVVEPATAGVHEEIELRLGDRSIRFLNGGFPVNFDGSVNNVPAHQIQLTRALMIAGAVQAALAEHPGIELLSDDTSDWLSSRL